MFRPLVFGPELNRTVNSSFHRSSVHLRLSNQTPEYPFSEQKKPIRWESPRPRKCWIDSETTEGGALCSRKNEDRLVVTWKIFGKRSTRYATLPTSMALGSTTWDIPLPRWLSLRGQPIRRSEAARPQWHRDDTTATWRMTICRRPPRVCPRW